MLNDTQNHEANSLPCTDEQVARRQKGVDAFGAGACLDNKELGCTRLCAQPIEELSSMQIVSKTPARLHLDRISTPIGAALVVTDEDGVLRALDFFDYEARMLKLLRIHYGAVALQDGAAPAEVLANMSRYFDGELEALRRISWATAGTPFQRSVWTALTGIASGHTLGYGELARLLGAPNASRAVGLANGNNPIAIVVPCHRVIGANGMLTGYAGGLHRKRWLLRHEGARFAEETNRDLFSA